MLSAVSACGSRGLSASSTGSKFARRLLMSLCGGTATRCVYGAGPLSCGFDRGFRRLARVHARRPSMPGARSLAESSMSFRFLIVRPDMED